VHLALRDVEIDAVERDDLAERLAEPARTDRKPSRRPGGDPPGRRVVPFSWCPETQCVSELGM
jgi:hypothetical protein